MQSVRRSILSSLAAILALAGCSNIAERAFTTFSARYGFTPTRPIRMEVYRSHADFSVRTGGLAGLGLYSLATKYIDSRKVDWVIVALGAILLAALLYFRFFVLKVRY